MPNMELIQSVTVGAGGASTISFTSIPQTYTDLILKISSRDDRSGVTANAINLSFNGSTSNFTYRVLEGNGATAASGSGSTSWGATSVGPSATASTFSNCEIYIPNYAGSNNKSFSSDFVTENNATTAFTDLLAGLWSQTAAITSITLTPNTGTNFVQYSTAYLYGVTNVTSSAKATGGTITSDGAYFYHTFTSSGTFTPTQSLTADYLVVAGGGGGGSNINTFNGGTGGGGAGGLRCTVGATGGGGSLETPLSLTAQAYTVTVGAGGAGTTAGTPATGSNGSNSVFSSITSTGGGGGGKSGASGTAGTIGGSGGGSSSANGALTVGAAGTANQGCAGGDSNGTGAYGGGGGGGAGAVGGNGNGSTGGNGGNGVTTSINGVSTTYAGGGGGGSYGGTTTTGGTGGGANGIGAGTAGAGTANTGGGGGGAGATSGVGQGGGGAGGSGIVIVRYAV